MTRIISLFLILTFLNSCNSSYQGKDLFGASEFVLDSYKIREGKFAILEMVGKNVEELDDSLLEEGDKGGEVAFFGAYKTVVKVDGKMTLYEVLEGIEMNEDTNLFHSYVLRGGEILPVDFSKLINDGDLEQNIVMQGGDRIHMGEPKSSSVNVMGDFFHSCVIDLPCGKKPLKQVIAESGVPFDINSQVQVVRGSFARPKIYSLSFEHVLYLPNESLLVIDGDTVYISRKSLTRVGLSAYD